jgi:predicted lysophospholipase L1 biosynthesis ABC-type transport system permease subunit
VAWLQLQAIDGRPIDAEYLNRMWVTTCDPGLPSAEPNALGMDREIARRLGAHLGSRVEFLGNGRTIAARIAELPERRPIERIWYGITFDCAVLAGQNTAHHIYAKVEPAKLAAVVRGLQAQFPKLPVGRIQDLFAYFGDAAQRAAEITRVMSVVVAVAMALLLLAVIAIWQGSFRREIAIYKILGARRHKLIALICTELSWAGLLAACIGGPLGCGAASVVLSALLQRPVLAFHWMLLAASIPAAIAVTNIGGWLISFGLLETKPLDVLRERG